MMPWLSPPIVHTFLPCANVSKSNDEPERGGDTGPGLARGELLVMGGDQCYPSAQIEAYDRSLDAAFANFEKLSPSTAQRVVRFWQVRQPEGEVG